MFNSSRFSRLVRWTIQRSPAWYLFVHFAACILITITAYYLFDEKQNIWSGPVPFVNPAHFLYGFAWVNVLAMLPVAAHFISRHFRDDRQTIDYLTLPVSGLERFTVLFIGLFVILPVLAWTSSLLFFLFIQLFGSEGLQFPHLKWMWSAFNLSLLPYFAGAVILFGLGLIRPKLTILWALGITILVSAIAVILTQVTFDQRGVDILLDTNSEIIDNFFGPSLQSKEFLNVNAAHAIFNQMPMLIGTVVFSAILFITSAWRSLNAKQV